MAQRDILRGPGYLGGKNPASPTGTGRWIHSLLPWDVDGIYAEPFAGMLGVLLQRRPQRWEIANDLDDVVANWWDVVREQPDALAHAIRTTPRSQRVYERAVATQGEGSPVWRALAFLIVQNQSSFPGRLGWSPSFLPNIGEDWRRGMDDLMERLTVRLRNVQLTCEDALRTLKRLEVEDHAIIYCDPPYADTHQGQYRVGIDHGALRAALLAQKGRVLISGYGDEWDDLGWARHARDTFSPTAAYGSKDGGGWRTEVAWANYDIEDSGEQGLLL